MSEKVVLKQKRGPIEVDRRRIGISYSGGGPLVLIELGCARAFVEVGIRPVAIAGVSAGSIAGAAHALDIKHGTGIDLAIDLLADISNASVGLSVGQIARTLVLGLFTPTHLPPGIGDHRGIKQMLAERLSASGLLTAPWSVSAFADRAERRDAQPEGATGGGAATARVPLLIGATDRVRGTAVWFTGGTPLPDAIVASSAIPGLFPWITMSERGDGDGWVRQEGALLWPERVMAAAKRLAGRAAATSTRPRSPGSQGASGPQTSQGAPGAPGALRSQTSQGQQRRGRAQGPGEMSYLVDGGVVVNQPLSTLALEQQCGTILACAVGYFGQTLSPPTQAIDNAVPCLGLLSHQCSKLEEDYVRLKTTGVVHHIHPEIDSAPSDFNLSSINVREIVRESYDKTMEWLAYNRGQVEKRHRDAGRQPTLPDDPLWWVRETWPDDEKE